MNPADEVQVVYEAGKVGIIATHGPVEVTLTFSPDQAEQLAPALLSCANKARQAAIDETATPRPS